MRDRAARNNIADAIGACADEDGRTGFDGGHDAMMEFHVSGRARLHEDDVLA